MPLQTKAKVVASGVVAAVEAEEEKLTLGLQRNRRKLQDLRTQTLGKSASFAARRTTLREIVESG